MLRIMDKYRYLVAKAQKTHIKNKIRVTGEAEKLMSGTPGKRLKHAYMVNKAKFWSVPCDGDVLDVSQLDEKGNTVLQHRIRT